MLISATLFLRNFMMTLFFLLISPRYLAPVATSAVWSGMVVTPVKSGWRIASSASGFRVFSATFAHAPTHSSFLPLFLIHRSLCRFRQISLNVMKRNVGTAAFFPASSSLMRIPFLPSSALIGGIGRKGSFHTRSLYSHQTPSYTVALHSFPDLSCR